MENDFNSFYGPNVVEEQTLNDVNSNDDVCFEGKKLVKVYVKDVNHIYDYNDIN